MGSANFFSTFFRAYFFMIFSLFLPFGFCPSKRHHISTTLRLCQGGQTTFFQLFFNFFSTGKTCVFIGVFRNYCAICSIYAHKKTAIGGCQRRFFLDFFCPSFCGLRVAVRSDRNRKRNAIACVSSRSQGGPHRFAVLLIADVDHGNIRMRRSVGRTTPAP